MKLVKNIIFVSLLALSSFAFSSEGEAGSGPGSLLFITKKPKVALNKPVFNKDNYSNYNFYSEFGNKIQQLDKERVLSPVTKLSNEILSLGSSDTLLILLSG